MCKVVYKYELTLRDLCTIRLPIGAQVLSVGVINQSIFLWALVDPGNDTEARTFRIAGTGHAIANGKFHFIGTVFMRGDFGAIPALVFHIFEAIR